MLMKDNQNVLGMTLKDRATGFTGVAVSTATPLYGMKQINLQPKWDGKAPQAPTLTGFDAAQLEIKDKKRVTDPIAPVFNSVRLGDEVEDKVSTAKGIVTRRYVYLNGCVYYEVVAQTLQDGAMMEHFMNQDRLRVIKANGENDADFPVEPVLVEVTKAAPKPKKPGGPMDTKQRRL